MIQPFFPQHLNSKINKFKVFLQLSQSALHGTCTPETSKYVGFCCLFLFIYLFLALMNVYFHISLAQMEGQPFQAMARLRTQAPGALRIWLQP